MSITEELQRTEESSATTNMRRSDLLKFMQYIGRHAPPFRGKHFLIRQVLSRLVRSLPSDSTITTRDGVRLLHCDLNQYIYWALSVYGIWEPDVTWIYERVLAAGDTVVDIGACFGYHAMNAALRVGNAGRVCAIEPQPDIFATFRENVIANSLNIEADCLALSEEEGVLELHRFSDLGFANTSMSTLNRANYETLRCPTTTLDNYAATKNLENITLIKVDVEGAELSVLKGANCLLDSRQPPMWVLEINMETAQACGYHPNDLLEALRSKGYSFYRVVWGKFVRNIQRVEKCDGGCHGDNILCVSEGLHRDRLRKAGVN